MDAESANVLCYAIPYMITDMITAMIKMGIGCQLCVRTSKMVGEMYFKNV